MAPLPDTAREILDFWFGAPGSAEHGQQRALWFEKRDSTDAAIRSRFAAVVEQALAGGLADWDASAHGALARILLLDQFTRNIFRNTPRAFAGDALALAAADALIARGGDNTLMPVERIFAYLPFEHAEDIAAQDRAVALFDALKAAHPGFETTYDYALRHQAVIARFGRFPHRNAILGRADTDAERTFLATPGSGF
ncbi:DUF924 family protein [Denitromonas iodatirespirans]|uniref:DUF924 domain-containing protein n=1 Tax=Denitromonas iodatirespirans TaxID=2795389 RepID=A0A944H9V4_DENI1|nr:DUF924 family protein [Denitromonas iodatirespirans]MBT0959917.1 DUF924 domain-containing protein [Denitromonas iodatirespirans]